MKRGKLCWHCANGSAIPRDATPDRSRIENLREAAYALADADSEDDAAFTRADDRHRHAARTYVLASVAASHWAAHSEAIRKGLARARANGIRLGRPRVLEGQQVAELVKRMGVRGAARALGAAPMTVWREIRRVSKLESVRHQHKPGCPCRK